MKDSQSPNDNNMDKKTTLKIAELAKIDISQNELDSIAENLTKILELVDEMNTISTDKIEPMAHPLNFTQRLRKDEVLEVNQRNEFQKNCEYVQDGYYIVPKIID